MNVYATGPGQIDSCYISVDNGCDWTFGFDQFAPVQVEAVPIRCILLQRDQFITFNIDYDLNVTYTKSGQLPVAYNRIPIVGYAFNYATEMVIDLDAGTITANGCTTTLDILVGLTGDYIVYSGDYVVYSGNRLTP